VRPDAQNAALVADPKLHAKKLVREPTLTVTVSPQRRRAGAAIRPRQAPLRRFWRVCAPHRAATEKSGTKDFPDGTRRP